MARPAKAKRASLVALKSMFAEFICRSFVCLFVYRSVAVMDGRRDDVLVCL